MTATVTVVEEQKRDQKQKEQSNDFEVLDEYVPSPLVEYGSWQGYVDHIIEESKMKYYWAMRGI